MAVQFTDFLNAPRAPNPFAAGIQGLFSGIEGVQKMRQMAAQTLAKEMEAKYMPQILESQFGLRNAQSELAGAHTDSARQLADINRQKMEFFSNLLRGGNHHQSNHSSNEDIINSGGGRLGAAVVPEGMSADEFASLHPEYASHANRPVSNEYEQSNRPSLEQALTASSLYGLKTKQFKDEEGNTVLETPWGKYKLAGQGITTPMRTANQKRELQNKIREYLLNEVNVPHTGTGSNLGILWDRLKYLLSNDQGAKENLIQGGLAEKLKPEIALTQLGAQGAPITDTSTKHQQEVVSQGWPWLQGLIAQHNPEDVQREIDRRHNELIGNVANITAGKPVKSSGGMIRIKNKKTGETKMVSRSEAEKLGVY